MRYIQYLQNIEARNELIKAYWMGGKTLQECADKFELSTPTIHRIITNYGLAKNNGGQHIRKQHRIASIREKRISNKKEYFQKYYGCSEQEFIKANGGKELYRSKANKFTHQRNSAKSRGIEWTMTFPEWCEIWEKSGHWNERRRGGYVMCRTNDIGPYAVNNVRIDSIGENIREFAKNKKLRSLR